MGGKRRLGQDSIKKLQYEKQPVKSKKAGELVYPKDIRWLGEPTGFGVRVFPSGKKSYIFKYRNKYGQQRLAKIGSTDSTPLVKARETAKEWDTDVDRHGKDPLEEKQKNRKGRLMRELCDEYVEKYAKKHKKSWKEDERRNLLYILPAFGPKQVQQIRRKDVFDLHHRIGAVDVDVRSRRTGKKTGKPYMANRVLEQLSKMFAFAKEQGYLDESLPNPAWGIKPFDEFERDAYIKPEHWPIVAEAIERDPSEIARCAIWMYVFTGKRRNEILESKWDDVDEVARTLKIAPGAKPPAAGIRSRRGSTKGGEAEFLPLSDETWSILERAKKFREANNPYIFPSPKKTGGHLVNVRKPWTRIQEDALSKGVPEIDRVPIHGLRHTVAVWLTNLTDADLGLVRKILNHKSLLATKKYAKYKTDAVQSAMSGFSRMVKAMATKTLAEETDSKSNVVLLKAKTK